MTSTSSSLFVHLTQGEVHNHIHPIVRVCRYARVRPTMHLLLLLTSRIDAGTFGTMGVGPGFAIAAALWCRDHAPGKRVVCIEGDSAIGFSGMELETVTRCVCRARDRH